MKEDRAQSGQFAALRQRAEEMLRRQPEELRETPPEDIQYLVHEFQVHQIELEMQNEELRRTQRELELSRDRYSDRYDFAPVGYLILSETGLIQQANLTTVTMLGVERGRLIKQPLTRFITREDQDIYYLHHRKLLETQEPQVCEMRMVREDGSQFWARIDAAVALDSEGQVLCRATMSDITERKQAREALAETTRLLETILNRTHVLVAYLDPHFNFVWVNRAYAEADERKASFFPGKNHFDLYPDAENEKIFRRVVETGEPYFAHAKPFEYAEHPERGVSYWDWSLVPTQDPVGAVTGLVFTLENVTDRVRVNVALQESERRFRQLAETVQDAFWLGTPGIGKDRQVLYVNPAFEEIFGVGREEIYKSDNAWLEAVYEEDRNRVLGLLEGFLLDQDDYDVEYRIVQPDGSIRWIWARGFDIRSEKGEIYRTAGLAQDITERKQAEEKLRHRTKELEALRQMGLELTSQLDATALLHSVVFRAMELLDGNATGLALYDAEHDILKSVTNAGQAVMPLGTVIQRGQGLSGTIWETGKPVVIDRYENPVGESATSKTSPIVAAVGVPIIWGAAGARDEFLGTLVVKADPPRTFSSTDVDLLCLFATQAAIAIRNARLYASLQQELAQRRRAEEALRESEDNLHRAGQIAHVGYWSRDVASGEIAWSDETYRIFGFEPQAMKLDLTTLPDYIHPEDRQMVSQAIQDAVTGIKPYDLEYRALRPDGMVRWVHSKGEVSYSEDGQPVRMFGVVLDITEGKQAEEALRKSERNFRLVTETIQDVFWISAPGVTEMIHISPAYERIWGKSTESLYESPRSFLEVLHPEDLGPYLRIVETFHAKGKAYECEYRIVPTTGAVRWIQERGYPITDDQGNVVLMTGICTDVTERRRAEDALRESEEKWRSLTEYSPDHIMLLDRDANILFINHTIPGLTREEVVGTSFYDYALEECREVARECFEQVLNTGSHSTFQSTYRHEDGTLQYFESHVGPVRRDDSVVGLTVSSRDITERKQAEETLRESEQQYRRLVEGLPDIVWSFSDKRGTLFASARVEAVLGYTPDYLYENPWLWNKSIHPDDQEHIGQAIADFAVGKGLDVEYRIKGAAGDWLGFRDRSIHRRAEGDETIIEGISTNITERKWIEEELQESEKRFRQMAENSRDVFWLRDLESLELLYITPAYERLWGQSIEDAYKKPRAWLMHVHPEDRDRLAIAFERQARGEPTDSEYRIVWPDGSVHWLRDRVTPVLNEAGEAYRMFGVMENITERVKAEEALRRRNRELVLLNRAGQAFGSTLDLEEVLVAVLEEVRNLLNVIACSIWILDPETGELVCQQATGPQSEVVRGWRLAPGQGIVGSTVARGESLIVPDTHADARYFAGVDQQTGLALRSVLSVPLRVKEEVIGVLQATDTAVGYFDAGNLALLEPLAATAATHIENVRLYEQVRRYTEELEHRVAARTRDLSTLYEVTAAANESLDLETALVRALEHVLAAMQSTVGGVYLVDEADVPSGGETLRLVVEQGLPSALAAQLETAQSGHGLVGWVFEHGEPLLVPDISADPRASGIPAPPLLAYVGVPIQVRRRPLGVLGVLKGENQPPFNIEEITLLTSIADHMGIVVESARLRQQVEQAAVLEERERLARELHDSITQSLYGLTLFARWARDLCEEGDLEAVKQRVVRIGETAQQALKEMRLLVYELRPELLEQDGLVGALRRRLEAVEKRAGVEVYLQAGPLGELPAPAEEGLYRIAQEALNNALKHASASSVTVRIEADDEQVALEIEDNGIGLVPDAADDQGGLGLGSMRERAQKLGGTLTILSEPGKGTTVRVRLGVGKSFQERGPAH
jgi:PAS domain S-box-containing protein